MFTLLQVHLDFHFLLIFKSLNFQFEKLKKKNLSLPPGSGNPMAAIPNKHFSMDGLNIIILRIPERASALDNAYLKLDRW